MAAPRLTDSERLALGEFKRRLQRRYGDRLVELRLFGSRARGDHRPDSDADVAVVLRGASGSWSQLVWDMADDTYDILVGSGFDLQPLPLDQGVLTAPELHENPGLVRAILREGVTL